MASKQYSKLNEKLDLILKNQNQILQNEDKIFTEEEKLESEGHKTYEQDQGIAKNEEEALKELEKLEREVKKYNSPIKQITKKDFVKGFIGAFVGVMSHFAFSKAADIAPTLDIYRSTLLYIIAFIIIIGMLYYTGFKNVKKQTLLHFIPARALILYLVSIATILIVNLIFGKIHIPIGFWDLYTLVSANIILAVMGAGTADLIGGRE